jgi:uncharacterized protein YbaA (DUF1428 family)
MSYVDGFVLAVPKKNVAAYRRMSRQAGKVWRDHRALEYRECVGDELNASFGPGFLKGIKAKRGETVMFSWILYKSKAHRNRVNAAAMKDPRIANADPKNMPFDAKRMLWGGFKVIVDF